MRPARRPGEDTRQASGAARQDRHGQPIAADGRAVDPRDAVFDGDVVDEVACLEVIAAVEYDVGGQQQAFGVFGRQVGDLGLDPNAGVDPRQPVPRGGGFWEQLLGVGLLEEPLPLQIARLDVVAVDDDDFADPARANAAA